MRDAFSLFISFSPLSSLFPWAFAYVNRSLYYLCTWYLINAVTSHVASILYQFSKLDKCCCRKRNIYIKKFGKRWFYLRLFCACLSLLFLAKRESKFFSNNNPNLVFFSNWIKIYCYLVNLLVFDDIRIYVRYSLHNLRVSYGNRLLMDNLC